MRWLQTRVLSRGPFLKKPDDIYRHWKAVSMFLWQQAPTPKTMMCLWVRLHWHSNFGRFLDYKLRMSKVMK